MPLTALVDGEDRIAISHAGDVGLVIFEADINALLAAQRQWRAGYFSRNRRSRSRQPRHRSGLIVAATTSNS
jgi:hypothetical protein